MTTSSALYAGHIVHRRMRPTIHRLRYRIFSLLLDLDEIDAVAARLRLFSRNHFNLFAFHDRDHGGGGTGLSLRAHVEHYLGDAGIIADGGAIRLLTMPRILGFAFNPLSVYFCHRRDGRLVAILYEVNNTFGERHSYLLPVDGEAIGPIRQECAKRFHVSPFLGLDLRYGFRVLPPGARLSIAVTAANADGPVLTAIHRAERRPLTDAALARVFVTYPLLSFKVVGGILWEALKLWTKGIPVHPHPAPPDHPVTLVKAG